MNISTLKKDYDYFSSKLSEITRQLNYAGIAIIWIFRVGTENGGIPFTKSLIWPLALFALSLVLDFLHYTTSTIVWGIYFRIKDRTRIPVDKDFRAPIQLNWPSLLLFWLKVVTTACAFMMLGRYIAFQL